MPRYQGRKRSRKAGLEPGAMIYVGDPPRETVSVRCMGYGPELYREETLADPAALGRPCDSAPVVWVDVEGVHRSEVVASLGQTYGLHPLIQEDIMNTDQRPKLEDLDEYLFIVLRMLDWRGEDGDGRMTEEQVCLVLGRNFLLSFQEGHKGDVFGPIRERIRTGKGRIRRQGADYLAYGLLDAIVDKYFLVLEKIGEELEDLEEDLVENPQQEDLTQIYDLRRRLLFVRRAVWPLRDVLATCERDESPLIADSTRIYLRDVYDHTVQLMDTLETYRDILTSMIDIYMSSVSMKLNEVMKVLTVIATLFMPLTFIAGVYGMNFKHMPELEWQYGYHLSLGLMAAVALGMVAYFKRKRWF